MKNSRKLRSTALALVLLMALLGLCAGNASADVIIDNGAAGTSFTGTWPASGGTTPYGTNSVWSRNGDTYTWQFSSQPSGTYEVYMWWSGFASRASSVNVEILNANGTDTVNINQQLNAGQWNSLGQFPFNGSGSVKIIAANGATISTCADAVWFRYVPSGVPTETIIDNGDPATSFTGTWDVSGAPNPYGANSVYGKNGETYTWRFTPDVSGQHTLSMWWTSMTSRSNNIPVDIQREGGTDRIYINQQTNGGMWNALGTYSFVAGQGYNIKITAPSTTTTCADAVKFTNFSGGGNTAPVATIESITPNPALPGETLTFSGYGDDSDGSIKAYSWRSDKDGPLDEQAVFSTSSLSTGIHTIFFKVQDDNDVWSPEVSMVVYHLGCDAPVRIMPLGDSITRGTGEILNEDLMTGYRQPLHQALTGAGYNIDFVGARLAGQGVTPPFDIDHQGTGGITDGEVADNVYNYLTANPADIILLHIGTNELDTNTTDVEEILNEIDRYSSEIPVVLARIIDNSTHDPNVTIFNDNIEAMALNRIAQGDKIVLVDQEHALTYPNDMWDNLHPKNTGYGKMSAVWFNGLDSILPFCGEFAPFIYTHPVTDAKTDQSYFYQVGATGNPAPGFSLVTSPAGMTIDAGSGLIQWTPASTGVFDVTVQADNGAGNPALQTFTINVFEIAPETIIDNGGPNTSFTGTWDVSGAPNPYGANSVYGKNGETYTWRFTPTVSGQHTLSMWWTSMSSRSTNIPVDIQRQGGTDRIYINQQTNGGQWNALGTYSFVAGQGYNIKITAPSTTTTCADAVKFGYISP